jgi:hypothetical protein
VLCTQSVFAFCMIFARYSNYFLNDINKVVVVMETQYVFWELGTESRRDGWIILKWILDRMEWCGLD